MMKLSSGWRHTALDAYDNNNVKFGSSTLNGVSLHTCGSLLGREERRRDVYNVNSAIPNFIHRIFAFDKMGCTHLVIFVFKPKALFFSYQNIN